MKNSQFADFKGWLEESLSDEYEHSNSLTEFGEMKASQGKRICISEILEALTEAEFEINNI